MRKTKELKPVKHEDQITLLRVLCQPEAESLTWSDVVDTCVVPKYAEAGEGWNIFGALLASQVSTAVIGEPGSGKTHLSFGYEHAARNLGKTIIRFTPADLESETAMIQKAALAGLVGYLENFTDRGEFTSIQLKLLATLISLGGDKARNLIDRYCFSTIQVDLAKGPVGAAAIFEDYCIGAAKNVAVSESVKNAWTKIKKEGAEAHEVHGLTGCLYTLLRLSGRSGLDHSIEVIIDVGAGRTENNKKMVEAFLSRKIDLDSLGVLTRWFVPPELTKSMSDNHFGLLELRWSEQDLLDLLKQRFRSIGSRMISLDEFGYDGLDHDVITGAKGNPRIFLALVDDLLIRVFDGNRIIREDLQVVLTSTS